MPETYDERVTRTVNRAVVRPGLWGMADDRSHYAIEMDGEKGPVWVRSADWATYGRMYGFDRVAVISTSCDCCGYLRRTVAGPGAGPFPRLGTALCEACDTTCAWGEDCQNQPERALPVIAPPIQEGEACQDCDEPATVKRLTALAWYGFCFTHDPQGENDFNYCGDCGQSPCLA